MKSDLVIRWTVVFVLILSFPVFSVTDEEILKIKEAMPNKLIVKPEQQRTMLVFSFCNGFKHSSIPYWIKALDIMSEKTRAFKVIHSTDMSVFAAESLKQFDAICFNNTTKLVPDETQQKAILDFVKSGKGIIGIHAATDNFYKWPEGMQMMGGKFTGHPWRSRGTWAIKLDEPDHPLMKSFKSKNFKINDEIYRTEAPLYSREKQRVLMSLDMSDPKTKNAEGVRPDDMDTGITWIKPVGKGRLFYCSLGHVHSVTWNRAVLEHFLAGIQYAVGDYEVDDTPLRCKRQSKTVSLKPTANQYHTMPGIDKRDKTVLKEETVVTKLIPWATIQNWVEATGKKAEVAVKTDYIRRQEHEENEEDQGRF